MTDPIVISTFSKVYMQIDFVQRAFNKYKAVLIEFGLHNLFERAVTLSYQMFNNTYRDDNALLLELQDIKIEDWI